MSAVSSGRLATSVAVAALSLPLMFCQPASAQTGPAAAPVGRDDVQRALADQKKAEALVKAAQAAKQSEIAGLAADRDKMNQQLIDTAKQIQRIEGQLTAIEASIADLETKETAARADLESRHDQIAQLLGAMQRMGRNPPPVIITKRDDALEMVRSAMLLARAFPELRAQAEDLAGRLTELIRLTAENRAESEKLRAETQRLGDARIKLAALMDGKKQSMAERQKEFEDLRKTAQEIAQGVNDLNVLIVRLDQAIAERQAEPKPTSVRTLEFKAPDQQSASAGGAAGPDPALPSATTPSTTPLAGPGSPAPLAQLPPPASQPAPPPKVAAATIPTLPPRADSILQPAASRDVTPQKPLTPRIPFDQARGRLSLPVQGKRILGFGDKNSFGRRTDGQVFEARFGAQVTSPADGWILFAGPFRNYGQLLIISVGSGYYIVLAGMSQVDVQTGQWVSASEPVGTMAPAPKSGPKDSQPALYVDFRKDGKNIDPQPWWAATEEKVTR